MLLDVSVPVDSLPAVAFDPDQAPDATQDVVLFDDHVSDAVEPLGIVVGVTLKERVGSGKTVTVTLWVAPAPGPVQFKLNVLVLVSAPVGSLPAVVFAPDQAPDAVQDVASVDDHVSVAALPFNTLVGLATSETVAAGGGGMSATTTVTSLVEIPPAPAQLKLNVLVAVNGPVDWLPAVVFAPDHAPDAVQDVAFVDDHVSSAAAPFAMFVGSTPNKTVGGGGNTLTVTLRLVVPPRPAQVSV